jgi:hypothetical protein
VANEPDPDPEETPPPHEYKYTRSTFTQNGSEYTKFECACGDFFVR